MTFRRLTIQLTPLVDLLLILVFSQIVASDSHLVDATRTIESRAARQVTMAEQQAAQYRAMWKQQELAVERVEGLLAQTLGPAASQVAQHANVTADDESGLIARLANTNQPQLLRHLEEFAEIEEHSELWEVHVATDGLVSFRTRDLVHQFRGASAADFAEKLFDAYKQVSEPRSLVVIAYSYGDAQATVRREMLDALPLALEQMRLDRANRSWFELSLLGFRPSGPLRPLPTTPSQPGALSPSP